MRAIRILRVWLLFASLLGFAQDSQHLPRIEGESLSGQQVVLPNDASGKVAVLIMGFTKNSKNQCGAWADKLYSSHRDGVAIYQLAVLEDVPRFIRGMVISGIRKGTAENRRQFFLPVLKNEAGLKQLVNYKEADDAYLMVMDRTGKIVHQLHGSLNEKSYSELNAEIERLLHAS